MPIDETRACLCLASRRAARSITAAFDRALRPHGLRATQFTLLSVLAIKGPTRIGTLATIVGTERTTMTRNVAVAEKAGLVVTHRDEEDARQRLVGISARGRAVLEEAFVTWRRVQGELAAGLGAEAVDGLRRFAAAGRRPTMGAVS
ncbi:MarR family winged helix-turn-helix transcriptional regulator [Salinarimonas rosea]|uniref:MarR family winged helix-turn-helix transcriptional regulator n=1 Tax=Salinarimonas rosea TaxID=552063 RepID=UPI00040D2BCF|nr:MarR family winged helix-turn-helix transcriptional regulator [Salinarimonas rosea]